MKLIKGTISFKLSFINVCLNIILEKEKDFKLCRIYGIPLYYRCLLLLLYHLITVIIMTRNLN